MSSMVPCPECQAFGMIVTDGEVSPCWMSGYNGYVELPVTPELADAIYRTCVPDSDSAALVNQVWDREGDTDCPECTVLRRCDDCYTEIVSW